MESACIFSLGLSLFLSSISKTKQIKLAFAFLKNFETAFFRKIVATVHFCVMFANCRIFVAARLKRYRVVQHCTDHMRKIGRAHV